MNSFLLQVSSECDVSHIVKETRSIHERRNTFQSTLNPQSETTIIEFTDISYDVLSDVVLVELSCMDQLSTLLVSVPDEMCYLSKDYIAHTGNVQCWTGSSLGRLAAIPILTTAVCFLHYLPSV